MHRGRLLLALFFLSGAGALIYQVIWVRMLGLAFGVTAFAVATVLASFMAGLALGNWYFGTRAGQAAHPLRLYAALELGIGLYGAVFPVLLALVKSVYLHGDPHAGFALTVAMRFVLSCALLLPPTILMGGTLPAAGAYIVRLREEVGRPVGHLYAANNIGAAMGCLAAGFVFIMGLGVLGTLYLAVSFNLIVALIAWCMGAAPTDPSRAAPPEDRHSARDQGRSIVSINIRRWMLGLFAIEGFVALAYEVIWIRILSASVLVNSVYSFSIVAASCILGLSLGSWIIARFVDGKHDLIAWFAAIEIAVGICSALLLTIFSGLPSVRGVAEIGSHGGFWLRNVGIEVALSMCVLLAPATLMGMLFPLVVKLCAGGRTDAAHAIGAVGGLNTLGSIAGSLAGALVLTPMLGMYRAVLLLSCVNLLLGIAAIAGDTLIAGRKRFAIAAGVCAAGVLLVAVTPHSAVFWRNLGTPGNKLVYYQEDCAATVSVVEGQSPQGPVRTLDVDGIPVAGTDFMLRTTQKMQAHIPLLLYESSTGHCAANILAVGLGSGGTGYSALTHDGATVTCVELIPAVAAAARKCFADVNHDVFGNPRYRLVFDDGRNFVASTRGRYDAILTESVHPIYAGNASLYTRDYFAACRKKLTRQGIVSVWVPIYRISPEDLKTILRTFQSVFPHCSVWFTTNSLSRQVLLIGSMRPLSIDIDAWRRRVNHPAVRNDLAELRLDDAYKMFDFLLMSEDDIREYAGAARWHTDDRPLLEFSAPKSGSDMATWKQNLVGIAVFKKSGMSALRGIVVSHFDTCLSRYARADSLVLRGIIEHFDNPEAAIGWYCEAEKINPGDAAIGYFIKDAEERLFGPLLFEAQQCERKGDFARAADRYRRIISIDPQRRDALARWAISLGSLGLIDSAESLIAGALRADPSWADGHKTLGVVLVRNRLFDEARRELDTALALDPGLAEAYSTRAIACAGTGRYDNAIDDLNKAIALAPNEPAAYGNRAYMYRKIGRADLAAQDESKALMLENAP
jgi:spermidine synthase